MQRYILTILILLFSLTLCAATPLTLNVRALDGGGFVLSQSNGTEELSFQGFCLDKRLTMPGQAVFNLVRADQVLIDPIKMQQAAWLSRQQGSLGDLQAAIWAVMGDAVLLSTAQQQLVLSATHQQFDLSAVDVLVSTNSANQRYIVTGVASSTKADVPEPASLLLLGGGLLAMARKLRRKV